MRKHLTSLLALAGFLLAGATTALAQTPGVGIGTTTPNASAALDVSSTTQGLLIPRMTAAQAAAIQNPADGLLVYRTDGVQPGLWYYKGGTGWTFLNPTGADNLGSHTATQNLNLAGNKLVGNGGTQGLAISSGGNVGIGTATPRGRLDVADGDNYLVNNPNSGNGQSLYLPGHLFLAPYSGSSGTAYVQARVPNSTTATNIGLNLRTTNAGAVVEAIQLSPAGAVNLPALGGTGTRVVTADASGNLASATTASLDAQQLSISGSTLSLTNGGSVTVPSSADNLGNHTATQNLNLATYQLVGNGGSTGLAVSSAGNVGLGLTGATNRLDVQTEARSGSHATGRALYVTGNFGEAAGGAEFRHSNGTQGVGIGYNSLYASGDNTNQHLNLMPKGNGGVGIGTTSPTQKLDVVGTTQTTNAIVTTALTGSGASIGSVVGLGIRADGGLNIGQNTNTNIFLGYLAGQANTSGTGNLFVGVQSGYANTTGSNNYFSGYNSGFANTSGSYNLFVGSGSGQANTSGGYNHFVGYGSGLSNTTGSNNQFDGFQAGSYNTTGAQNYFSGYQAGAYNTTGSGNHFSGYLSGANNTTGASNQFTGDKSGANNSTGNNNVFSGFESGLYNTTGSNNYFSGWQSGYSNTTASQNHFVGYRSGVNTTTGSSNQFEGYQAGYANTTGSNNHFAGVSSGVNNTTGSQNYFSGYNSGFSNTTGNNNQFDGFQAGGSNTTGEGNYFSGYASGFYNTTGASNQFMGYQCGLNNTVGSQNMFAGYQSGANNTTGISNHFDGYQSGLGNINGNQNHFVGFQSGASNTSGSYNTFNGFQSGVSNTSGGYNTFSGYMSGAGNTTGQDNVFTGWRSGYDTSTGTDNIFSGSLSGYYNTTGRRNVALGTSAHGINTIGNENTSVGFQAGGQRGDGNAYVGTGSGTSNRGSNNTGIGARSDNFRRNGSNNTALGADSGADNYHDVDNTTAVGANVRPTQSNTVILGNNANVGIGTTAPAQKLDVVGSATVSGNLGIGTTAPLGKLDVPTGSVRLPGGGGSDTWFNYFGDGHNYLRGTTILADLGGYVGIGTSGPAFPLDVQSTTTPGNFAYGYLNGSGSVGTTGSSTGAVSIRAAGRVVASEFNATSDRRLKNVIGLSDHATDLALLNKLRITDYTMRDRVQYGERKFKKVIAQEVEQVFPQAVNQHSGFLPDIYANALSAEASADSLLRLTLPAAPATAARVGQRLKLITKTGEVVGTVQAAGGHTLTVRGARHLAGQAVFVFGLEHADVRTVDYEALSMLNVSATQELARKVALLEQQNAALRTAQTQATADTAGLAQRLAALENLLGAKAEAK